MNEKNNEMIRKMTAIEMLKKKIDSHFIMMFAGYNYVQIIKILKTELPELYKEYEQKKDEVIKILSNVLRYAEEKEANVEYRNK